MSNKWIKDFDITTNRKPTTPKPKNRLKRALKAYDEASEAKRLGVSLEEYRELMSGDKK